MKVWKNKNMPEWNPENGTHYQQRITLGEKEQHEYGLNYPIGTHYPNLSILDYFSGEPFRKHKMDYCNTCIKIVADDKRVILKGGKFMDKNRYNTKVRQAMSDKYKETSKKKEELENELYAISLQLTKDEIKKTMAYSEYMELNRQAKVIQTEIDRLNIECDVWDKAREICMDIADEEA